RTATLETRSVRFNGSYLFANVDCPAGALKVEILDDKGRVIPFFSARNSNVVSVDRTLQEISWAGGADISRLRNMPVKFRFFLTNGRLYSFWVSPDASGASHGYLGAGSPGNDGVIDRKGMHGYADAACCGSGEVQRDPGLEPPVINTHPLPNYDYDKLDY